jgi:SepF-like predicted cell division protein (DUF552 family)
VKELKNETKAFLKDPYNEDGSIKIPDGFEVDMEKLKEGKILLRKKEVKKWEDIPVLKGCYINEDSTIYQITNLKAKSDPENKNVFIDDLHAKRGIAEAQISQLMQYYGGEITHEEWKNKEIPKFAYVKKCGFEMFDVIKLVVTCDCYHFLSFHTTSQASEFLENNEEIVRDYFMMS